MDDSWLVECQNSMGCLWDDESLPFNVNDSQEMVLLEVLAAETSGKESSEEEVVRESLREMKCGFKEGCSPVVELKRRHSMIRKRSACRRRNGAEKNVVVLEDLGAEFLEQLLTSSESATTSTW
nr:ethylene-responsive transcription factor 1B-like [Ipomoea trifida]